MSGSRNILRCGARRARQCLEIENAYGSVSSRRSRNISRDALEYLAVLRDFLRDVTSARLSLQIQFNSMKAILQIFELHYILTLNYLIVNCILSRAIVNCACEICEIPRDNIYSRSGRAKVALLISLPTPLE